MVEVAALDNAAPTNNSGKRPWFLYAMGAVVVIAGVVFLMRKTQSGATGLTPGTLLPNAAIALGSVEQRIAEMRERNDDIAAQNAQNLVDATGFIVNNQSENTKSLMQYGADQTVSINTAADARQQAILNAQNQGFIGLQTNADYYARNNLENMQAYYNALNRGQDTLQASLVDGVSGLRRDIIANTDANRNLATAQYESLVQQGYQNKAAFSDQLDRRASALNVDIGNLAGQVSRQIGGVQGQLEGVGNQVVGLYGQSQNQANAINAVLLGSGGVVDRINSSLAGISDNQTGLNALFNTWLNSMFSSWGVSEPGATWQTSPVAVGNRR